MLTLNQTYEDSRSIKILVVPLGNNNLFDRYFEIVSRLREIPFYELNWPQLATASANNNTKPKILRHINLNNGSLRFDYLRYDRVLLGPGDLDNFQSSKRVLMIIGLVNYPELAESRIEEEFDYYSRKNPNIILKRIFVFNYFLDEPIAKIEPIHRPAPKSLSKDPTSVIVFPPEGNCSEGAISMVEVHLQEVMAHTSVKLFHSLEKQLNHCEEARLANNLPVYALLSTQYDEIDDVEGSAAMTSFSTKANRKNVKKGLAGRIHKWMGDLCMQMCSPLDAVENYAFAINECRTNNDSLWLAGALDGYASSILLLITFQYALEDILGRDLKSINTTATTSSGQQYENGEVVNFLDNVEAKCVRLAEERAYEAATIYSKNIAYSIMEVECLLRLARMYETNEWVVEREHKILEYVIKATTVSGLNNQQHIECMLEGGLIFHRLGMRRKYGFFLYATALLCIDCDNLSFAQSLIHYASEQFGIISPLSCLPNRPPAVCNDVFIVEPNLSWSKMRAVLFTKGISISAEVKDDSAATRYVSALLRLMADEELRHSMTRHDWIIFQDFYFRIKESQSASLQAPVALAFIASPSISSRAIHQGVASNSAEDSGHSSPTPPPRPFKLLSSPPLAAAVTSGYSYQINSAHINDAQDHLSVDNDHYNGGSMHRSGGDRVISGALVKGLGFDAPTGRRTNKDTLQPQPQMLLYASVSGKDSPVDASDNRLIDRVSRRISSDSYVVNGSGGGNRSQLHHPHKEIVEKKTNVTLFGDKFSSFFPKIPPKLIESIENDTSKTPLNSTLLECVEHGTWFSKEAEFRQIKTPVVAEDEYKDVSNFRVSRVSSDFTSFISCVLSEEFTPTPQQDETIATFMEFTRRIPPNSIVTLPVSLISLRPRRFVSKDGSPINVTHCPAILAAQENYVKRCSSSSGFASNNTSTTESVNTKSSALFFDPFAKKRAKQKKDNERKSTQVLWSIGGDYFLVAVFSNPFSTAIVLSNLQPIIDGNSCRDVCSLHLFPISVTIPARTDRFEVDLRVQIHPVSKTIVNIERSMKVLGIQIRVNNAECSVTVDKAGLASSIEGRESRRRMSYISYLSASVDNRADGVATNEVTVIAPLPRLALDFTKISVVKQLDESKTLSPDQSSVDLAVALDILPGEKRTETLVINQLPLAVLDELGRGFKFDGSSAGSDLKISIYEVDSPKSGIGQPNSNKKQPTGTADVLNYSRFLFMSNTDSSPAVGPDHKKSSLLKSKHCTLKSFETKSISDKFEDFDRAFNCDEVAIEFSHPENPVSIYIDIEVATSFDRTNLENISRLSNALDVHALPMDGLSIQNVYARLLKLRVDLIPQLGLHLTNAQVMGNSHFSDESEMLNKSSLIRTLQHYHPNEDGPPEVEISHEHISVSYEILNRSNFSMLLGSEASIDLNSLDLQGVNSDVDNGSFHVVSTSGNNNMLSPKSTPILRIPASSSRKILLRYPPVVAAQLPSMTLHWACTDSLAKRGRVIRNGKFVCSVEAMNFSFGIPRNVRFQPPVRVYCNIRNGDKNSQANEVTVKSRTFIDVQVFVCLAQGAVTTQVEAERLELVITILNRDMLVVDRQKSGSVHRDYVVSGTMHRSLLIGGLVGESIMHTLRICFLRQGNYSIHPLFRLVSGRVVPLWWTSSEQLMVTVNLE